MWIVLDNTEWHSPEHQEHSTAHPMNMEERRGDSLHPLLVPARYIALQLSIARYIALQLAIIVFHCHNPCPRQQL